MENGVQTFKMVDLLKRHMSIILAFCLMLLCLFYFSGCNNKIPLVSELTIRKDLLSSSVLRDFSPFSLEIQQFQIEKRQTFEKDKIDKIFVNTTLNDEDKTLEIVGSYIVTYGLYSDGWLLDSVEIVDSKVSPLVGAGYDEEILCEVLEKVGYEFIGNLDIYSHETMLDENIDMYSVLVENNYNYLTECLDLTLCFTYDIKTQWSLANVTTNSRTEDWIDFCGVWYTDDKSQGIMIDFFDGETFKWYFLNQTDYYRETNVVNVKSISFEEYAADYLLYGSDLNYYRDYAFTPVIANIDWEDIEYACSSGKLGAGIYFGPEHCYVMCDSDGRTESSKSINFFMRYEIFPAGF